MSSSGAASQFAYDSQVQDREFPVAAEVQAGNVYGRTVKTGIAAARILRTTATMPAMHPALFPFHFDCVLVIAEDEIEWKGRRWKAHRRLNTFGQIDPNTFKWFIQWTSTENGIEAVLGLFDKLEESDELLPMPWEVKNAVEKRRKRLRVRKT